METINIPEKVREWAKLLQQRRKRGIKTRKRAVNTQTCAIKMQFQQDCYGIRYSCLACAVENGHTNLVRFLLTLLDKDVFALCKDELCVIATKSGNLETVKIFFEQNSTKLYEKKNRTLQVAMEKNYLHIVEYLLTTCPPQSANDELRILSFAQDVDMVRYLLNLKPNLIEAVPVNGQENAGMTCLHLAASKCNQPAVVEELLTRKPSLFYCRESKHKWTAVDSAISSGCIANLAPMIRFCPTNPDVDHNGDNVLHWAVTTGDLKLFQIVLNADESKANVENFYRETPMHYAVMQMHHVAMHDNNSMIRDLKLKSNFETLFRVFEQIQEPTRKSLMYDMLHEFYLECYFSIVFPKVLKNIVFDYFHQFFFDNRLH